jgi:hypothetical protein
LQNNISLPLCCFYFNDAGCSNGTLTINFSQGSGSGDGWGSEALEENAAPTIVVRAEEEDEDTGMGLGAFKPTAVSRSHYIACVDVLSLTLFPFFYFLIS